MDKSKDSEMISKSHKRKSIARQENALTGDSPSTSHAREFNLPDLPDVPVLSIVSFLPLQQLIVDIPLLHRRFTPIRESVLKSNQRLSLSIGYQRKVKELKCMSPLRLPFAGHVVDATGALLNPETGFYQLNLDTLDTEGVNQLSTLMPGIVYLEVAMANVNISIIQQLITLLTHWAPSLATFKLITGNFYSADEPILKWTPFSDVGNHLRQLLGAITDNLLALEHLSLNMTNSFYLPLDAIAQPLDQAISDAQESLNQSNTDDEIILPRVNFEDQLRQAMGEAAELLSHPLEMANELTEQLPQAKRLLEKLKRVSLNFVKLFKSNDATVGGDLSLDLSLLGRLREFNFAIVNDPSVETFLLDALQKHASERLRNVAIGSGDKPTRHLADFANHRLASHFTTVPLGRWRLNDTEIVSLENLLIYRFAWHHVREVLSHLRALSSLPRLQCLQFSYHSGRLSRQLMESFRQLPPFASVTVLEMTLYPKQIHNHHRLNASYWAQLFPAVQIVKIRHNGTFCTLCHPNGDMRFETIEDFQQICLRKLLAPLRVFPSLRRIFYQRNCRANFIGEFTSEGTFVQTHEYIF